MTLTEERQIKAEWKAHRLKMLREDAQALVRDGWTRRAIAKQLKISESTLRTILK